MPAPDEDAELLEDLLSDPDVAARDFAAVVQRCAAALGVHQIVVYLADLQQRHLMPLTEISSPLDIDNSLAGWAYRTLSLRVEESATGEVMIWLPLVDGTERLGVMCAHSGSLDAVKLRRSRATASLLAMMVTSKRAYKETFVQRTRTETMQLPAELLRAYLPPRTIGNSDVVSTAVLEPAYEVGGDAFDHALTATTLHAAMLDSMGHDLASGLTSVVTLAACRNARRTGADLPELVMSVDEALARWLPDQFCTGVLLQLEQTTGVLRWINCGHPPPLLIRNERLVEGALSREADPPLGLAATFLDAPRTVHEISLEPGDRVLLYTDGVTEARMQDGSLFGLDRFAESVIRATAGGELAAETLRRLIHWLLDAEHSRLRDDATILMVEWQPRRA
ncbi:PP2C family protein-serine/threonine phosphatase [Streptomyces sp. NPDC088747]|uniref:PP2C family protein-serine/threonine phosphatase n=1 Tax=Streptomyces sp. NPDC088747 TaxID=3365886 RepID=UPI0038101F0B